MMLTTEAKKLGKNVPCCKLGDMSKAKKPNSMMYSENTLLTDTVFIYFFTKKKMLGSKKDSILKWKWFTFLILWGNSVHQLGAKSCSKRLQTKPSAKY